MSCASSPEILLSRGNAQRPSATAHDRTQHIETGVRASRPVRPCSAREAGTLTSARRELADRARRRLRLSASTIGRLALLIESGLAAAFRIRVRAPAPTGLPATDSPLAQSLRGRTTRVAAGRSLRHESDRPGTPGGVIASDGKHSREGAGRRDRLATIAIARASVDHVAASGARQKPERPSVGRSGAVPPNAQPLPLSSGSAREAGCPYRVKGVVAIGGHERLAGRRIQGGRGSVPKLGNAYVARPVADDRRPSPEATAATLGRGREEGSRVGSSAPDPDEHFADEAIARPGLTGAGNQSTSVRTW